jgi:hypothetical protein
MVANSIMCNSIMCNGAHSVYGVMDCNVLLALFFHHDDLFWIWVRNLDC